MLKWLTSLMGWPALLVIAIAIAGAQFLAVHRVLHRALWVIAAVVAVVGCVNEWRR
jgi:uncharacterized membrane protein